MRRVRGSTVAIRSAKARLGSSRIGNFMGLLLRPLLFPLAERIGDCALGDRQHLLDGIAEPRERFRPFDHLARGGLHGFMMTLFM